MCLAIPSTIMMIPHTKDNGQVLPLGPKNKRAGASLLTPFSSLSAMFSVILNENTSMEVVGKLIQILNSKFQRLLDNLAS